MVGMFPFSPLYIYIYIYKEKKKKGNKFNPPLESWDEIIIALNKVANIQHVGKIIEA
jgi:hypothetical protein